MMDEKIRVKLEELILKAIEENTLELAAELMDLRVTVARIKSFENK